MERRGAARVRPHRQQCLRTVWTVATQDWDRRKARVRSHALSHVTSFHAAGRERWCGGGGGAISSSSVMQSRGSSRLGSAVGKDAAVPKRFYSHSLSLPHKPTPPARAATRAPKSVHWHSLSLFFVYPSHHDLAERTAITQPSPARLALPSSHAASNSGRGGGSLACSGASTADCWPPWPALSEARGATAEVGYTVLALPQKEPISFRLKHWCSSLKVVY